MLDPPDEFGVLVLDWTAEMGVREPLEESRDCHITLGPSEYLASTTMLPTAECEMCLLDIGTGDVEGIRILVLAFVAIPGADQKDGH